MTLSMAMRLTGSSLSCYSLASRLEIQSRLTTPFSSSMLVPFSLFILPDSTSFFIFFLVAGTHFLLFFLASGTTVFLLFIAVDAPFSSSLLPTLPYFLSSPRPTSHLFFLTAGAPLSSFSTHDEWRRRLCRRHSTGSKISIPYFCTSK